VRAQQRKHGGRIGLQRLHLGGIVTDRAQHHAGKCDHYQKQQPDRWQAQRHQAGQAMAAVEALEQHARAGARALRRLRCGIDDAGQQRGAQQQDHDRAQVGDLRDQHQQQAQHEKNREVTAEQAQRRGDPLDALRGGNFAHVRTHSMMPLAAAEGC